MYITIYIYFPYFPRENQNCNHLKFCIKNVSFVLSCPCYISKVNTQSRLPRKQSLRTRHVCNDAMWGV